MDSKLNSKLFKISNIDKINFSLLKSYLNDLISFNKKDNSDDYTAEYIVNLIKDNHDKPEMIFKYIKETSTFTDNSESIFHNLFVIINDMQSSSDGIGKEIIKYKVEFLQKVNKQNIEKLEILENLKSLHNKSKDRSSKYKNYRSRSRTRSMSRNNSGRK